MTIWLDAQLSPAIAPWIAQTFGVAATPVRDVGLRDAKDHDIFAAARAQGVVVMTKDADFAELVERLGVPPQVLWLRSGNTSNARLREVFARCLPDALKLLESGEKLVEITDPM